MGKPVSVTNGLVTTRFTEYSAVGELLRSQQEFDGVAAPYTFHYAYNMAGQMVSETYPSGRVVMNTFDSEGKADSVSSRGAGHAPHIYANGFHYNDKGMMDRLRMGNALWAGAMVNNRYQTTQITVGTSSGGSDLLKLDYNYGSTDNNGDLQSQTITVPTIGTATCFVTTQAYTYDSLNRLANVEEKQYGQSTADWRQQFGYDRYGNRAMGTGSTQTFGRNSTETQSLIGPDPTVSTSTNRITNKTGEHYEFDASGNMTKDALGNRSVYDIENHQTEYYYSTNSSENPDAKYFYDGDGKRIKKKVGSETTVFVYDAGGKLVAEYTIGVTANPSSQTNYITTDTLGSTRLVTNGAGHVIARHDYLPFGDEIYGLGGRTSAQGFVQPDTTRQRFTGYEHDAETGLDFAQARYYGNGFGRFTGVDPTPESAKPSLPESWNRYTYCLNNPLNLTDPNGLDPSSHWGYQQFQGNDGRKWIQFGYWTGEWKDGVFYDRLGQAWQQWSGGNWYVFSDDSAVTLGTNGKCIEFSLVGVEGVSDEMRASLRATQQAAGITTGANFSDVQLEALKTAMIPEYRKTPEHQWNMFLASMAGGTAGSFAPRFSFSFMTASESAVASQPNRIYSSRVLLRSAEESGPYHNFPQSFDQQIFSQGRRTVTTNFYRDARPLVTSDSILYELPGTINKTNGVFQIGVRPSAVGNTELIWHRFFKPIKGFP